MKFYRVILTICLVIFIVGCAEKSKVDSYKVVESFVDENESFIVDEKWYLGYKQTSLNLLVSQALKANKDLEIASINSLQALARVGLIKADMLPTFGASWRGESGRDISVSQEWIDSFGSNLGVSYELDLYGKIRDSVSSAQWLSKASVYDLEAAKLNIINLVVSGYFKELFIRDALSLLDENLNNYKKLKNIVSSKVEFGRSMPLENLEIDKTILNLQNQILSYQRDRVANLELLRNLLHLKPNDSLNLSGSPLMSIQLMGVDMSVPLFAVGNRPDLRSYISEINSSFYDYKVKQKSFYPSITLGGSIAASSDDFRGSSELDFLSGNVVLKLPFLDYKRLKSNLIISELEFDKRVASYEKGLNLALNEINRYYRDYENFIVSLQNSSQIASSSKKISTIYLTRYNLGKSELKDYLEAKNAEISSSINLLSEKYKTLNSEISVYKAMAGKFRISR